MKEKLRIGITHGDFNGINYEIIMKTFADAAINEFCTPVIYGSSKAAAYYRKALNMENFNFNVINDASEASTKRANILNVTDDIKVEIGLPSQVAGISAIQSLDMASKDLQDGKISAIVACPINNSNASSDSYTFAGHTAYFAEKFGADNYVRMMVNELMRVSFVSDAIPFGDIPNSISKEHIMSKISLLSAALQSDFMIRSPRIAVLSINPVCGNGSKQREEKEIIFPAVEEAKRSGILVFGPYSADDFFALSRFNNFDVVLAMYHDQGMIPFQSIGLSGAYYTAGLPVVATSPAHGTGYQIAGKGVAAPASLRDALFLAIEICRNRKTYAEINSNVLKIKTNHPKKALE
jgi:4-hydroxythreonine-4-phosphate dehydrogenase